MTNTCIRQNDGYSKKELLEIIEEIDAAQKRIEPQAEKKEIKREDHYSCHTW